MSETIIIAIIGIAGTVVVEVLRRILTNRQTKQQQMLDEMRALQSQVKELQDSLDEWKTKYYQLLLDISQNKSGLDLQK